MEATGAFGAFTAPTPNLTSLPTPAPTAAPAPVDRAVEPPFAKPQAAAAPTAGLCRRQLALSGGQCLQTLQGRDDCVFWARSGAVLPDGRRALSGGLGGALAMGPLWWPCSLVGRASWPPFGATATACGGSAVAPCCLAAGPWEPRHCVVRVRSGNVCSEAAGLSARCRASAAGGGRRRAATGGGHAAVTRHVDERWREPRAEP